MQLLKDIWQIIITAEYRNYLLEGFLHTLVLTFVAALIGLFIGLVVAIIKIFSGENKYLKIPSIICNIYTTVVRGTPVALQLFIMVFVILAIPGFKAYAVILTFGINSGAYVSEIFRAGFEGIDKGQREASKTLGLNYIKTMRYVIFPQALAKIFPALGNEVITLVKETSIAGYIGIVELIKAADIISSRTYDYFFPLVVSAIVYLLLTFILSKVMTYGEKRLNHGV